METTCSQCEEKAARRKISQISMILKEKVYYPLGPPPNQPRKSKFEPKCGKIGQGTKGKDEEDKPDIDNNSDLLRMYGVPKPGEKVKSGDIIIASRPFVHCLATSSRGKRCEGCYQKAKLKLACGCNCVFYCSRKCQEQDAEFHEDECMYFRRKRSPPGSDTARFLLRFLLRMRKDGHRVSDVVPWKEEKRKFKDLLDHFDDIVNGRMYRRDMINAYYEEMIKIMGLEDAPDPDYFLECYGRMAINSFNILDENQEAIGLALYLGPSIMDHSCQPNAAVNFDGINIVVRSLIDRDELDFSEVQISYISLLEHTQRRREHLRKHYYFECQCIRCLDPIMERPMFCVQCPVCSKDVFVGCPSSENPIKPESCSECDFKIDEHSLEKYVENYEIVSEKMDAVQIAMDVVEFCFKLLTQSRVTPFHILFLKTTEVAFNRCLSEVEAIHADIENTEDISDKDFEIFENALFHGLNLVAGYAKYSKHCWSHEGEYLVKVAELEFVLGNNADCERHLLKAKAILEIACGNIGPGRPLLSKIENLLMILKS